MLNLNRTLDQTPQLAVGTVVEIERNDGQIEQVVIYQQNGRWNTPKGEYQHTYEVAGIFISKQIVQRDILRVIDTGCEVDNSINAYHEMMRRWKQGNR